MTRILGIDPGSQRTGIGIIDVDAAGKVSHVHHAPLVLLGAEDFPQRLRVLLDGLTAIITTWQPDEVAIEKVFMARNPDSALKLGQARGAAISAVVLRDLPVHEYAAKEVKLAVVGRGSAERPRSSTWSASCSTCMASCRPMPPMRWPSPSPMRTCAPRRNAWA